jgi:hypothetical protein
MAVQKNFKITNGIEVNTNLIFGDTGSNKVGIATTNAKYTLHVNGGIGATNSVVTGVSTVTDLVIAGKVGVGNSFGAAGQYLVSTGTGVTWGAVPTVRSSDLKTAGVGATTFNTTYTVGLLDVYVNGVKLSADEYSANNGATVILDDACFGGETVEFISYSPFGIGIGGTSIQGITILEEGSPVGSALQVTSINFVGAAVTAVGSGIGVTVYVNDSVNPNYWASTGAGIHTLSNVGLGTTNPRFALEVGAVGASGTTLYVNGDARITGILTVGTSSITLNGATNTINVGSGVTIDGAAGTISATTFVGDGSGLVNVVGSGSGIVVLDDGSIVGTAGTIDFGANLSVSAISAGVVTVTASGGASTQWETTAAGINTLSSVGIGTTNPTSALTVVGSGASISQLYVTGVSTFNNRIDVAEAIYLGTVGGSAPFRISRFGGTNIFESTGGAFNFTGGSVSLGAGATVTGTTFTNQLNVSGVSTLGTSNISGDLTFTGNNDIYLKDGGVINFGDGNDLQIFHNGSVSVIRDGGTGGLLIDSDNEVKIAKNGTGNDNLAVFTPDGSVELYYDNSKKFETLGAGVTVTGTTFTNQLSVSGVSTFSGNVRVGVDTSTGVILTSPNGTQYRLIVDDSGTLSTVAV